MRTDAQEKKKKEEKKLIQTTNKLLEKYDAVMSETLSRASPENPLKSGNNTNPATYSQQ